MPDHPPGLKLEQDILHQKREWKIERIGWLIMAAVILAAFLGLFGGSGPLLTERRPMPERREVQLEYPHFGRYQSLSVLTFHHMPQSGGHPFAIWLDEAYLGHFDLQRVTPTPYSMTASDGKLFFRFHGQPRTVTFHLQAEVVGPLTGRAGVADAPQELRFRQFFYP